MAGKPTVKGSRCDIDIDMELRTRTYIRGDLPSRATWRRRMLQVYNWASYADSRLYTKLVNCWPMLSNLALGVLEKLGPWPNSNAWSNKATSCWLLGLPCLSSVVCRLSPVACPGVEFKRVGHCTEYSPGYPAALGMDGQLGLRIDLISLISALFSFRFPENWHHAY